LGVVGLGAQQVVEDRQSPLEVALGGVNLGQRDGRHGRRRRRVFVDRHRVANALRRLGQVQAALDDRGDEVARSAEKAARLRPRRRVGAHPAQELVDELRPGEHLGTHDASGARASDELVAR
jgi:hypothetical protein